MRGVQDRSVRANDLKQFDKIVRYGIAWFRVPLDTLQKTTRANCSDCSDYIL